MENDKHYVLVGVFVIVLFLSGLGFTLWLTSAGRGETAEYRIRFAESVSGLKLGSPVRFRGVDVGEVRKIVIDDKDIRVIQVEVRVLRTAPIKTDTEASLKLQNISGDLYIDLNGNKTDAPELVSKDDSLPEIRAEKSGFNALMTRLPQLLEKTTQFMDRANHIAGQIERVFSNENIAVINGAVRKLADYLGVKGTKAEAK